MERTIVIDPVTRIEGHGRVTLQVNAAGEIADARFHVTQVRGFEKFIEGRPFTEMPSMMARICGICPVSHLMASAKACDALLAVEIPPAAADLRRLMHLAQFVQSHALSFFYLTAPDLLLGMDADPAVRNIAGLLAAQPRLAQDGIRLRAFGQRVIEGLGGKRVHPAWVVPGGVSSPLTPAQRDAIRAELPEIVGLIERTLEWYRGVFGRFAEEISAFANFPSLFMGLTDARGNLEFYDGPIRVGDAEGRVVADGVPAERYGELIGEAAEPWSYLKFPYYKPQGYPQGLYRVGPLARLNVVDGTGTPKADEAWKVFRSMQAGAVSSSFHYHYARLVEMLHAAERMAQLLADEAILDPRVRAQAGVNRLEGVGVAEAPRGLLIHHYRVNADGLMQWANLIIATGHNNLAMNRGILQAAQRFVDAGRVTEGMLNRVEAVIRAFDPCLSCSTHALGKMPLIVELRGPGGELLDRRTRA